MFNFDMDKLAEIANSHDNYFMFHNVTGGFLIIHSESIVAAQDGLIYTCHSKYAVKESLEEICSILGLDFTFESFQLFDPDC